MIASENCVEKGFCEKCTAESTEQTPGNVSATNGIGRKFYGSMKPCATCGSVIRTLWWTCVDIPLVPRGSYRYKTISDNDINMARFWARRTRTQWGQIVKTWLIGIVTVVVVVGAVFIYQAWRSH